MSSPFSLLAELREQLRAYVDRRIASLIEFPKLAKSSASGENEDAVEVSDGETTYQRTVRRVEQWGLRVRPPAGIRAAVIKALGGATNGMYVGIASTRYGPSNLEDGETALYCIAGDTVVKLDKDGKVTIDAAAGQDVVVNGGTLKVARDTDPISAGTLTGQAGPYPVVFVHTPPGGAPSTGQSVTLAGKITNGATRFKG